MQVFIVDDHGLIIEGLKASLGQSDDIDIIGYALNGQDCLRFLRTHKPDVVVLDMNLPDTSGIALCTEILALHPDTKVLGLSTANHPVLINQLLSAGAKGYLLKTASPSEIAEAIRQVYNGHLFISKEAAETLFHKPVATPTLTRRETEVLKLLAEGMTAPEVAEKLYLSQLTVESHRRNIMAKLKARNTAMLIRMALDYQLV